MDSISRPSDFFEKRISTALFQQFSKVPACLQFYILDMLSLYSEKSALSASRIVELEIRWPNCKLFISERDLHAVKGPELSNPLIEVIISYMLDKGELWSELAGTQRISTAEVDLITAAVRDDILHGESFPSFAEANQLLTDPRAEAFAIMLDLYRRR